MLDKPRKEIDKIDLELIKLLEQRFLQVDEVIKIKKKTQIDVLDTKREQAVLSRLAEVITHKEYEEALLATFQRIMDVSKEYQKRKDD